MQLDEAMHEAYSHARNESGENREAYFRALIDDLMVTGHLMVTTRCNPLFSPLLIEPEWN